MMILELFRWWYGPGWRLTFKQSGQRLTTLMDEFSVGMLLRTLFAPWRRIVTDPGSGLDAHMRAMLDNLVSRCVGFAVRSIVLLTVAVLAVAFIVFAVVQIIVWPVLPLLMLAALYKGVF